MDFLLRLKHWQLFSIVIGLYVALRAIIFVNMTFPSTLGLVCGLVIVGGLLYTFWGWFWGLGRRLHAKLPVNHGVQLLWFRLAVWFPVIYFSAVFLIGAMTITIPAVTNFGLIFCRLLISPEVFACSILCFLYSIYFCSKSLKMVELNRTVSFSDYLGDFFLIGFFPIGIWFIQPRINNIFKK